MKEYGFIFKNIRKASPAYIGLNLLNVVLQYISFAVSLVFYKVIVDLFLYGQPALEKVIAGLVFFYALKIACESYSYWIVNIYNGLQQIRIRAYISSLVYRGCKQIDIERYEGMEFYDEYARAVEDGAGRLQDAVSLVSSLLSALLKIGTVIGLFFSLDSIFIIVAVIYCVQSWLTLKLMNRLFYQGYLLDTPVNRKADYINGVFRGYPYVKELKLYRAYDFFIRRFAGIKDQLKALKKKRVADLLKILFSSNLAGSCLKAFVNIYVIYQIVQGVYTVGDFTLIFASVTALGESVSGIINTIPNLKNNRKMIGSLVRLLDYGHGTKQYGNAVLPEKGRMEIAIEDVSFAYPNQKDRDVLRHISLKIREGEKIAIVGENGSGKSTFLKLLLGLYEPGEGKIVMNGKGYCEYDRKEWQGLFGVVFQDYLIYQVSIAQNILFQEHLDETDEKLVWEALEFSGLAGKVRSLEHGIHSVLSREFSEEGVFLSGGEYQRLAIARAYARKARWIVFDEPTSALDPIAADDIMTKLYQMGEHKTVICVSHRLAATSSSDRILVFDQGCIAECGSHRELMEKQGLYYQIFMKQAGIRDEGGSIFKPACEQ